jgi:hypothetical protein
LRHYLKIERRMAHVILLGDSIFDNARYVPQGQAVIDHLRRGLEAGVKASLLAVDGSRTVHVAEQVEEMPGDASHVFLSIGGNDALAFSGEILAETATTHLGAMQRLAEIRAAFHANYTAMLRPLVALGKHLTVCTVYDAIPVLTPVHRAGLALFNDIILHEAVRNGLAVLDLRMVCAEATDYAPSSPIEPSATGGAKIARAIVRTLTGDARTGVFI